MKTALRLAHMGTKLRLHLLCFTLLRAFRKGDSSREEEGALPAEQGRGSLHVWVHLS